MNLPFRLGSTSYVYPGDLVENAQRLRPVVDDVELVLFHTPARSNMPDDVTIARLAEVAGDGLTFSLHLPTHLRLTHHDVGERNRSTDQAAELIERCHPLPLSGIVVHLEGGEPSDGDRGAWEKWQRAAIGTLSALVPLRAVPLCVENIERYPFELLLPVVECSGVDLCLDIGHLWKMGRNAGPLLRAWLPRASMIHLHGWDGTRDHRALTVTPPAALGAILSELAESRWRGLLTLEVFQEDFWHSRDVLLKAISEIGDERLEIGSSAARQSSIPRRE